MVEGWVVGSIRTRSWWSGSGLHIYYVPVGDHYLELVHVSCPILRKVDHVPFNSDRTTTGVQRQVECDPSPTMHHGDVEVIVLEL